ncbi:MAG: glycosyltransferase [Janthinobacterium lividum]
MSILGISITTFNRLDRLWECIDAIQRHTLTPYALIVADDGSSDGTVYMLRKRNIPFITGQNKGIAWNRNRGLFWLHDVRKCQTIISIEDDCRPTYDGWECIWIDAVTRWGHINNATSGVEIYLRSGSGTSEDPFRSGMLSGQCTAFSAKAFNEVGYQDSRFGRYGHEHVEHTLRFLRLGYGGTPSQASGEPDEFLLLKSGIETSFGESCRDEQSIHENGAVFQQIRDDVTYRNPWRGVGERSVFMAEIQACKKRLELSALNSGIIELRERPVGLKSCVIVTGTARSGTSMAANILHEAGVFMGHDLDDRVFEDTIMGELLASGDQEAYLQEAFGRTDALGVWGYKRPNLHEVPFNPLDGVANVRLVVMVRDQVAVTERAAIAHGVTSESILADVNYGCFKLMSYATSQDCPVLLCSYEKAIAKPMAFVRRLLEFAGGETEDMSSLVELVEPERPNYVQNARMA